MACTPSQAAQPAQYTTPLSPAHARSTTVSHPSSPFPPLPPLSPTAVEDAAGTHGLGPASSAARRALTTGTNPVGLVASTRWNACLLSLGQVECNKGEVSSQRKSRQGRAGKEDGPADDVAVDVDRRARRARSLGLCAVGDGAVRKVANLVDHACEAPRCRVSEESAGREGSTRERRGGRTEQEHRVQAGVERERASEVDGLHRAVRDVLVDVGVHGRVRVEGRVIERDRTLEGDVAVGPGARDEGVSRHVRMGARGTRGRARTAGSWIAGSRRGSGGRRPSACS